VIRKLPQEVGGVVEQTTKVNLVFGLTSRRVSGRGMWRWCRCRAAECLVLEARYGKDELMFSVPLFQVRQGVKRVAMPNWFMSRGMFVAGA